MNKVLIMNAPKGFVRGITSRYDYVTGRFTYDYHLFDVSGLNDMFTTDETHRLMEVDDETLEGLFAFMRIAVIHPVEMAALGKYIGRHREPAFWLFMKEFNLGQIRALAKIAVLIDKWVDSGAMDSFAEAKKEKAWWLQQFQDKLEAFVWTNTFNTTRDELYPAGEKKWEKKALAESEQAVKDLE